MLLRPLPFAVAVSLAFAAPVHAGAPLAPTADVSVAMTATDAQIVPSLGPGVSPVDYTATVTNEGPSDAGGVRITVELNGDQPVQQATSEKGTCGIAGGIVTCDTAAIAAAQADTVRIRTLPASTSDLGARASVTTASIDPRPGNNFAGVMPWVTVVDPQRPPVVDRTAPDTNITAPRPRASKGAFRLFRGTASDVGTGVSAVEVAVQVVDRGDCMSLTNSRGRFAPVPCSARKWLRATGTTSWRYRLKRALPPGRYRMYSRATDVGGLTEAVFRRSDHNVLRFTVR